MKARKDQRIEYMKKLKIYWDEPHPEFKLSSDKYLKDQALSINKNKTVVEAKYENVASKIVKTIVCNKILVKEHRIYWHTEGTKPPLITIYKLPRTLLITFYKFFIKPHVDLGDIKYDQANNFSFHLKLELIQRSAALAITENQHHV